MNSQQFHDFIILPTLVAMGPRYNSIATRMLMLSTTAHESQCGLYIKQIKGPALGPYQMEPDTTNDLFTNFLNYSNDKHDLVMSFLDSRQDTNDIMGNFFYATALARMQYYRNSDPMPQPTFESIWLYYKKYWNTELGAATKEDFKANWDKYVAPVNFGV